MLKPSTKRRHHVVPSFLLAQFAAPPTTKGKLFALDKESGNIVTTTSRNATIEKDYYVLPDDPDLAGFAKDLPEDNLERIERDAAPVIKGIRDGAQLPQVFEERAILALFAATLRMRTPRERERFS